jgi:hypothetical protein
MKVTNHAHCRDTTSMCVMWCSKGLSDKCFISDLLPLGLKCFFGPGINNALWTPRCLVRDLQPYEVCTSDLIAI